MKKKRGEYRPAFYSVIGLFAIILSAGMVIAMGIKLAEAHYNAPRWCIPYGDVDFVMYGLEGNRDRRSEDGVLLSSLSGLELNRVDGVPEGAVRHLDVGLYDGWQMVGTMLFWHEPGMVAWYVVINDGMRGNCGVYRVGDVRAVFDVIKTPLP